MEKVYRLLYWLDMAQAIEYLESLTKTQVTERLLLQLCEAQQCRAYADVDGVSGHTWESLEQAIALGIHLVTNPMDAFGSGWSTSLTTKGDIIGSTETEWMGDLPVWKRGPIFQPRDIESLAGMLGGGEILSSQSELIALRCQLEQERDAREAAELRAMQAEADASTLRQEIEAAYYAQKADEELAAREAHQRYIEGDPTYQLSHAIDGLIFPYPTKHLEAMRDAAVEFWQGHDITKPAPYGIQKTVQNFLAARTGENARKLAELAAAIKPDGLPKP